MRSDWLQGPNLLTLGRIVLIPFIMVALYASAYLLAALLAGLAFLTDFIDGRLARSRGQVTRLGSILDPVADKLIVIALFSYFFIATDFIPVWYFVLLLTRDLAQLSVIPVLVLWKKIPFEVRPRLLPKWGTALNFILLGWVFLRTWNPFPTVYPSLDSPVLVLFLLSAALEFYILVTFIPRYIQIYRGHHHVFE